MLTTEHHRGLLYLDPRGKLLLFVVTCVFVMGCTQPLPCLGVAGFVALLLALCGQPGAAVKYYLLYAAAVAGSILALAKLHGGPAMLLMGLLLIVRMLLPIMLAFTLVFQTTTISQFMAAFQKMRLPNSVTIPIAVMFRFVPTLQEEWRGIRQAMAFRGIPLTVFGVLRHPLQAVEHMLIPMLFSASAVMDELAAASLARGLDSDRPRTSLAEVRFAAPDYLLVLCCLGIVALWLRCRV